MSFKGWFKGSTPLQLAIERGLKPGGNLAKELDELDDYTITSKRDAQAICEALKILEGAQLQSKAHLSAFYALTRLFLSVKDGSEAAYCLYEDGMPYLIALTKRALQDTRCAQNEVLFALKILAAYSTLEGADFVVVVAKSGFAIESYTWNVVLRAFAVDHPQSRRVFAALSKPLPDGFLAMSLLDAANQFVLKGGEMRHPFDSDSGVAKLEAWLREPDPELFSYSHSATVALPFIQHERQDELFRLAYEHPGGKVRLEAAWAEAKLDRARGWQRLAELCNDVHYSACAQSYLTELHQEDLIPKESQLPDFKAKAKFCEWLSHANELGRPPDELTIIDHRDLAWPTDGKTRHFWLISYCATDTTGLATENVGVGLVGGITSCLFSYELKQRHPEDAYAIHCYWEMTHADLITDSNVEDQSEYDALLQQWNGECLEEAKVIAVSELEPEVVYPRRLIALATAKFNGESGWVVLDGPNSHWYACDEMPEVAYPKTVLMMHIGRRLLGFKEEPDRKSFIQKPEKIPALQIERAYERFLAVAENGTRADCKRLLERRGLLHKHFIDYVAAKCELSRADKAQCVADTYERLLRIAQQSQECAASLLNLQSGISLLFEEYAEALVELHRQQEVITLVEVFASKWPSDRGSGRLGNAALKAGRDDLAEKFYLRLKETDEDWQRADEISCLAEIWHRHGKREEARSLLIVCLQKMLGDGRKAEGSDHKLFEEWFQKHRRTFLKLFPDESLKQHNLPETTLR